MTVEVTELETVTIGKFGYLMLKDSDLLLQCLENAGVDNWDGYYYAMEEYRELAEIDEEDDDE